MTEQKFTNNHDIIVFALSLLLRQFQKEDKLFAAPCIWSLASIIQYTEILKYYLEYQIFPSDYIRDCVVSPLRNRDTKETIIPDSDIPELQLDSDSDTEYRSKLLIREIAEARSIIQSNRRIQSGRIVKPDNLSNKELLKRYPSGNKQLLRRLQESLRKDGLIL